MLGTALGIATIPEREHGLARVLDSLLPQVDTAYVYLDKYSRVPSFLNKPNIKVYHSEVCGDYGCPGKFVGAMEHTGYYVTVDDDIAYPADYVSTLRDLVMKSDDEVCAGVHGILLNDVVSNYYKDRTIFHFKKSLSSDSFVHLLGTGTLCFNTKNIAVSLDWMNYKELSDIVVAMELEKKGKRRVCAARPAAWLTPFKEDSPANTLYRRGLRDPGEATDLINSIKWSSVS